MPVAQLIHPERDISFNPAGGTTWECILRQIQGVVVSIPKGMNSVTFPIPFSEIDALTRARPSVKYLELNSDANELQINAVVPAGFHHATFLEFVCFVGEGIEWLVPKHAPSASLHALGSIHGRRSPVLYAHGGHASGSLSLYQRIGKLTKGSKILLVEDYPL